MIEPRQIYRLLTFGYENLLPNILSFWCITILPEIMVHNFHVEDKEKISMYCGYFYGVFFAGIVTSALLWPSTLKYISKRMALFLGLLGMAFFNYMVGNCTSLGWVFFYRYLTGLFHNFNSVGKDFIFQFARPMYRQYTFSIKTLFGFVAGFIGPFLGYWIYNQTGKSFKASMDIITLLFVIGLILYVLVFFLDFTPGDAAYDLGDDDEEVQAIVQRKESDMNLQKGIWPVLQLCLKNTYLRNLSIVYFLSNGVYKSSSMIAILYLETPWKDQGYGVNNQQASMVSLVSFLPAALLVIISPSFVPSRISYKAFIRFFLILMSLSLLALPVSRDLLANKDPEEAKFFGLGILMVLFVSVPKLYSPFINYNLNNAVDKYSRTALNSITFIFSTATTAFIAACIFPILGWSIYDPLFTGHVGWSKYMAFIILDLGLAFTLYILSKLK